MLLILEYCQDIYTRVHCTQLLAVLSQAASFLYLERKEQTQKVLLRLLSPSYDQSSSIYVGHLLICFAEVGLLSLEDLGHLIAEQLAEKFHAASSPSAVKSYAMGVSYFLLLAQDQR